MNLLKRLVTLTMVGLIVTSLSGNVLAQSSDANTANGFRLAPIRNELTIEKGKSTTVSIMVENPSKLPLKAKALINDFIPSDKEDGQPRLLLDGESAGSHSLKALIQPIADVDIAANDRKYVSVTVNIPTSAKAGGYYGAVRFVPVASAKNANISLTASVGSIFLVNVPGEMKEHLSLVQFSAAVGGATKNIITGGNVSIITRLKNDGDTHEKPFGKIEINDRNGKVIVLQEINNDEPKLNILPGSIRKFETSLNNKKWLGHYTVTASFGYDPSDGDLINAKTSFWYIPVWMFVVAGGLLLVFCIICFVAIHKFKKNHRSSRR